MIEDGVMKDPKVDYVFGLHIAGDHNSGILGFRAGPFAASPDTFGVRIIGRGGHGASPHETIDPVYVAAQVIIALQGVSGRMIDPMQPIVISVGAVHSGTKENIIPDEAVLQARYGRSTRVLGREGRRKWEERSKGAGRRSVPKRS